MNPFKPNWKKPNREPATVETAFLVKVVSSGGNSNGEVGIEFRSRFDSPKALFSMTIADAELLLKELPTAIEVAKEFRANRS